MTNEVIQIKIVSANDGTSPWYRHHIGETWNVKQHSDLPDHYFCAGARSKLIHKLDCLILPAESPTLTLRIKNLDDVDFDDIIIQAEEKGALAVFISAPASEYRLLLISKTLLDFHTHGPSSPTCAGAVLCPGWGSNKLGAVKPIHRALFGTDRFCSRTRLINKGRGMAIAEESVPEVTKQVLAAIDRYHTTELHVRYIGQI